MNRQTIGNYMNNQQLIEQFYTAFQRLDAQAMNTCYHDDAVFSDPVFGELRGAELRAMWTMLCARAKNFELTFSLIQAENNTGSAHWEAHYDFTATGRRVHNIIEARFRFRDGAIIEHRDTFSFYRWARQALGPAGMLLGWTPFLHTKVSEQALKGLQLFMQRSAGVE